VSVPLLCGPDSHFSALQFIFAADPHALRSQWPKILRNPKTSVRFRGNPGKDRRVNATLTVTANQPRGSRRETIVGGGRLSLPADRETRDRLCATTVGCRRRASGDDRVPATEDTSRRLGAELTPTRDVSAAIEGRDPEAANGDRIRVAGRRGLRAVTAVLRALSVVAGVSRKAATTGGDGRGRTVANERVEDMRRPQRTARGRNHVPKVRHKLVAGQGHLTEVVRSAGVQINALDQVLPGVPQAANVDLRNAARRKLISRNPRSRLR